MNSTEFIQWKIAAILLLIGGIFFWFGAFYPPYKQWITSDLKEYLTIISIHPLNWYIIHGAFTIGVILSIFGIQQYQDLLYSVGSNRILTGFILTAYLTGSIFWLLNIAFRLTVTMWAAKSLSHAGNIYDSFGTWMDWTNLIFAFYMVLAYFAIGCMGVVLRDIIWMPAWVSWFCIIFGFFGVIAYILRIPLWAPPLMVHLPLMIIGIATLIRLPGIT